jgi:formate dehydrogenase alpha subunit
VAGLATVFGSGAMTNSLAEIENNDVLFVIGSNTKENHPIVALRMIKAVRKGAKLIVADPRRVPLVRHAHLWLRQRPGTDVALLNGMMHVLLAEDLIAKGFIEQHTEGFSDEFRNSLLDFTPAAAETISGVPKEKIIEAARIYGHGQRAGIYYTMGITQHSHGTDNVYAIANLALMTGNLGKESAGVNPLRGQNNVQGSTDMGCSPNLYPGYQRVTVPAVRERFEELWGVKLSGREGLMANEMLDASLAGTLKALYILGENPLISDPDTGHTEKALKALDLLIVQDIFLTETAQLAHVVLPGTSFAEKVGTFTNTERRVQRVRRLVDAPGEARKDSLILMDLSRRLGYDMPYHHTEEIFQEIGRAWPAMAGMSYSRMDEEGGLQWPCPTPDHPGTPYLFKGGFPRGKARFTMVHYRPSIEQPDSDYPFVLTTGRMLFQYHTGSMTRRSRAIEAVAGSPYVEMNEADAAQLSVTSGDQVTVRSRRGAITLAAKVSRRPDRGVVFIPFHFREAAANVLTSSIALDPICKIPELKVATVAVEKAAHAGAGGGKR